MQILHVTGAHVQEVPRVPQSAAVPAATQKMGDYFNLDSESDEIGHSHSVSQKSTVKSSVDL